ncbi:hypothetical protein GC098_14095 [Paenibacillus sp. LMG 31458]|uniref:Restriction endonuclease n=2 Tax=Paenibacillus phytorum TaxID=2654977 RepID=A0ABX1XXV1_9BACL|nr:hypothetical protein [Paenibacillus phytorum]
MIVIKSLDDGTNRLLAVIEFKSMHGSVGNILNNRTEEAVGSSHDLWKAFEHGAFGASRPFLGYIYVMSDHPSNLLGIDRRNMLFQPLEEYMRFPRTRMQLIMRNVRNYS